MPFGYVPSGAVWSRLFSTSCGIPTTQLATPANWRNESWANMDRKEQILWKLSPTYPFRRRESFHWARVISRADLSARSWWLIFWWVRRSRSTCHWPEHLWEDTEESKKKSILMICWKKLTVLINLPSTVKLTFISRAWDECRKIGDREISRSHKLARNNTP